MKMDLAVLGLLSEQNLHGYELKRRLTVTLGTWSTPSYGSLYPALARLETGGAVRSLTESRPRPVTRAPLTGSFGAELAAFRRANSQDPPSGHGPGASTAGSRSRKVYAITEAGQALFHRLLTANEASDDRAFSLQLAFARHLSTRDRLLLLERRRTVLIERLRLAKTTATSSHRRHDPWASALLDHAAASTEGELAWLDGLLERAIAEHDSEGTPTQLSVLQPLPTAGTPAGTKEQ